MVQTKTVCTFLEAPRYRCIVETKKQCASYRMALMKYNALVEFSARSHAKGSAVPWWTFPLEVTIKDLRSLGGLFRSKSR